jgi:alpha-2-macroglobulin
MESYRGVEKVSCLHLLKLLEAKIDFAGYIDSIEKHSSGLSQYEKLRLLQLKQLLVIPISLDTVVNKYQTTLFGNWYWGEENRGFFNNSVQNTLLMYQLMRKQGGFENQLQKVRNYFLEKRKDGKWRNTYESSLILETILPDLLKNDSLPRPASLRINSAEVIHSFPYSIEMKKGEKIKVTKQGDLPVYFTAYQQYWNPTPKKVSTDFTVNSSFERNGEKQALLKAGDPVILKVNVIVKGDADYIMIEIPIPAGCSYKEKAQFYTNNEVHREYFKNKVSIFCKSLGKGEYVFTVSLITRYTGQYHLNPAKAEMMYFPVFFGREEMKKVNIH